MSFPVRIPSGFACHIFFVNRLLSPIVSLATKVNLMVFTNVNYLPCPCIYCINPPGVCEEVEEWSGGGEDGGVISECFLLFVCPVSSGSV